ncbi:MAG: flagellar hook protein FlgE [Paracoccaceae bacterium]
MTISSSLNAGVAGLNANAARLATISDNIANSATYGYKRADTDFHSMVINGGVGNYSAGGVRVSSARLIDERGPLISTTNPTDLAVNGRGMLPVTPVTALSSLTGELPLMLMTTGSFKPDADGILRTTNGMALMGWPAEADGTVPTFPRDSIAGLEPVRINVNQFSGDPTTKMQLGINLPATETNAGSVGDPRSLSVEYFGNLGTSESLNVTFDPHVPASGASNRWTMTISDSASGGAIVGEYELVFDDTRGAGGTLASVTTVSGGAYDAATGTLTMNVAGGPIELGIGKVGDPKGLTQLSDSFAPVSLAKNGSPVGNLSYVEVDANGMLHAVYDVGFTRTLYQIPLVDVPNPNGLTALGDQAYQISDTSGGFFLWNSGDGPTGEITGYAREESSTDVAAELTHLIQTQRAYSSNAKVIQTVDEMLQETTNIKR